MGYTIENKKIVIWTEKYFSPDKYPFHHEGVNWTRFYKNLSEKKHFAECRASYTDEVKREWAAKVLDLNANGIVLKSKHSHNKKKHERKN